MTPASRWVQAAAAATFLALLPGSGCDYVHVVVPAGFHGDWVKTSDGGVEVWTGGAENRPTQPDARASVRVINGSTGAVTLDGFTFVGSDGGRVDGTLVNDGFGTAKPLPAGLAAGESATWRVLWRVPPLEQSCKGGCAIVVRRHDASGAKEMRIDLFEAADASKSPRPNG